MAAGWTTEETGALVSIWGQANVQNELDGIARNRTVFEKIAKEMARGSPSSSVDSVGPTQP